MMMELPAGYPESPMDPDEVVFPCKGCGEVRHSPPRVILSHLLHRGSAPLADTTGAILDS